MGDTKVGARFNIQLNLKDPDHLQVAGLLNSQGHRGKAQYIVNAVLHYENCEEAKKDQRSARIDEKTIEAVVNRVLHNKMKNNVYAPDDTATVKQPDNEPIFTEEIYLDDAMDALGEDGFSAISGALAMFRSK